MISTNTKAPETTHDLHPLIGKRWSPRAFSGESISDEQVQELLEAARWAASSNNEQPWEYVYALKGTEAFAALWETLLPGNQPWSSNASVLIAAVARNTFSRNGKPNPWATHDLGMANAQLILQAAHRDIYGHMMAGFDTGKLSKLLQLTEDQTPVALIALGYKAEAETLEEPFRSRELSPRVRKPLEEFARKL